MAAIDMADNGWAVRIRGCNQTGRVVRIVVNEGEHGRCQVHVPALGAVVEVDTDDIMLLGDRSLEVHSRRLQKVERDAQAYLERISAESFAPGRA